MSGFIDKVLNTTIGQKGREKWKDLTINYIYIYEYSQNR